MSDVATPIDDALNEASELGRAALESCLEKFGPDVRDAFWNAIGLYYSTRRHPGAAEPKLESASEAFAA
ncbi:hypothetical protein [Methylobacterium gnaphalii]|uniref:Uncharacterized protein n=1 Tax=Methylobacterium gnaphalii TaxID=1010610 RepID=A0A512JIH4_9HYPH|nr:hypothetical protein [Methylobacterium gnaphalii]GEP09761.1 hypothetical protein MGN01_16060 [Methylobacterium gnaphalii]GJD67323.1 hypothetical protein MMMDOFMJ_0237 [Methylobacterium gnaphalii]GLS51363.1 hypothetical protein GCM10007885_42200 [Methylobacterium gnaphalii]